MNVHDEYKCTATYPFTCTEPVAYLVEYTCQGDAFAPADRYTCQGHADQGRKGDVLCVHGGCGRMGEAYPASVVHDGRPYCRRHGRMVELMARRDAARAGCMYCGHVGEPHVNGDGSAECQGCAAHTLQPAAV